MLDKRGRDLIGTQILHVKKPRQVFTFAHVKEKPVLSLLRDFSAPVRLVYPHTDDELLFLLAHDSDPFNRWEAGAKLATRYLLAAADKKPVAAASRAKLIAAYGEALRDKRLSPDFKATLLALPVESELGLAQSAAGKKINPEALYNARREMVLQLATALKKDFAQMHRQLKSLSPMASDGASMGKRALKNLCLAYLTADGNKASVGKAFAQAVKTRNMTDCIAALAILAETNSPLRHRALAAFAQKWRKSPSIMDRWLSVQAGARHPQVLKDVQRLLKHPAFDLKNPNRVSALLGAFAGNVRGFHAKDGSGYRFLADMIMKIDPLNPQKAAGLAKAFSRWREYDAPRQKHMRAQLKRLAARKLSANTSEIVAKSIAAR